MKIKYTKTTNSQQEIETTLLDILKWENDCERDTIFDYHDSSIELKIIFCSEYKVVFIKFNETNSQLRLDTDKLSPKQIIELIDFNMKTLGVEYEN